MRSKSSLLERNLIIEFGQQRNSFLFGFGDARSFVGTGETEEDVSHLFEQRTALLIGEDGVWEVRLLLVVYNLLDVGMLF